MSSPKQFAEVLHTWAGVSMKRSMRDFERYAREAGVSMPQISTMMRLHHRGACMVSEIGSHLSVTNAAASQMIQRLVEQGLLERSEHPDDRRVKQITLSEGGRALLEKGIALHQGWLESLSVELSEDEREAIIQAFNSLISAASRLDARKMDTEKEINVKEIPS